MFAVIALRVINATASNEMLDLGLPALALLMISGLESSIRHAIFATRTVLGRT